MQINHNISAVIANNQLMKAENRMTNSVQRLSSGLKINCAADDPSGMAISQKMKTQIRGLDRATDNSNDGISVLQTAEGALTEVHSMLQRMNELAVQSANGTYKEKDRQAIQNEINSLCEEIDRISNDTQFNNICLLDGSIDKRGYSDTDGISVITFSDVVEPAEYTIRVDSVATTASVTADLAFLPITDAKDEGTISINGIGVMIKEGEEFDSVYKKLRDAGEIVGVNVTRVGTGTDIKFETKEFGSKKSVNIQWSNNVVGNLNLQPQPDGTSATENITTTATSYEVVGLDTKITLTDELRNGVYSADGTKVTITDAGGFQIELDIDPKEIVDAGAINQNITLDIMDIGAMILQVGANEGETVALKIPAVNTYTLGLEHINMLSQSSSTEAIDLVSDAIAKVSSVRSAIGAYQNRLEHTISNLDTSKLNMENALSRIEDVDMAEEMTEYTATSVLNQAGTSVLAQANELPQTVLQLLQK